MLGPWYDTFFDWNGISFLCKRSIYFANGMHSVEYDEIEHDYYNHNQSEIFMVEKMIQEYSAFRKGAE